MKTLNFYHQKRKDGGIRTGVDFNGERVLEQFMSGRIPPDSALEWFVDVRCQGRRLPDDPDEIRHGLLEHGGEIQSHLEKMAARLRTGIDPEWPFTSEEVSTGDDVEIKIVCSAILRRTGRDISRVLLELKQAWPRLIGALPALQAEQVA